MKSALQAEQRHAVVRLHTQPSLLKVCTLHPCQLEGLNWLIKLHDDHNINGILADGTCHLFVSMFLLCVCVYVCVCPSTATTITNNYTH